MNNYKTAKILIISMAVLTCIIVAITFIIGFTKDDPVTVPTVMTSTQIIEDAETVVIEYKSLDAIAVNDSQDVKKIVDKFLSLELETTSAEYEQKGTVTFKAPENESGDNTVKVGFDEKFQIIELDGKTYSSDQILSFRNLLVTLTNKKEETTDSEETTAQETTTTTEAKTEETTEDDNSAYYSTDAFSVEWGGTKGYLAVAQFCENYDTLVESHTKHYPIVRITSVEELNSFIEAVKEYFDLDTDEYDEEFFAEDELFIIYADENTQKADHEVERVDLKDGKMDVIVTDSYADSINEGLKSRFIFMSMEKKAMTDFTQFDAYTEY